MKKINYLFFLFIVCGFVFTSCSSDDEDQNTNFKADIYLNNEKQSVSTFLSEITYKESRKTLDFSLYADEPNQLLSIFSATFENINLTALEVNDDLVSKAETVDYMLITTDNNHGIYSMSEDPNIDEYSGYIGKAIIKKIDKDNNYIEIEFIDAKVIDLSTNNDEVSIKGTFGCSIIIQ